MLRRLPSLFLCLTLFALSGLSLANDDEVLEYPAIGILSSDSSDHYRAWGKTLLSDDWVELVNKYDNYCKTYIPSISLDELKKLLVFTENDLVLMAADTQQQYDQNSVYFESCNYLHLGSSFIQTLFHLAEGKWKGWKEPELLKWDGSDAYIDTEYSLLLVKFLNKDDSIPFGQRQVSALFIRKDFQFGSNREVNGGFIKKVLGSKGFPEFLEGIF